MSARSRSKGARGELEAAALLRAVWPDADRAPMQARGAQRDGCEVVGIPYHVEVKYQATPSVYAAIHQAERDRDPDLPLLVLTREVSRSKRGRPWYATLALEELLEIMRERDRWIEDRRGALEENATYRHLASDRRRLLDENAKLRAEGQAARDAAVLVAKIEGFEPSDLGAESRRLRDEARVIHRPEPPEDVLR